MRTFEYKVEVNLSDDESDVPTTALNRLGTVGWESAGVTSHVLAPLLMNEGPTKANRTGSQSYPHHVTFSSEKNHKYNKGNPAATFTDCRIGTTGW